MGFDILLRLILAHIITDFLLQPAKWVKDKSQKKERSRYLLYHALLTGLVAYIALLNFSQWYIALFIMITHYLIDLGKTYLGKGFKSFITDQFLHFAMLIISWMMAIRLSPDFTIIKALLKNTDFLIYLVAFALILWPTGFAISIFTEKWRNEIKESEEDKESLANAGMYIGIFERILVLIFILNNQFAAIGFLIAAKSILRISQNRKTEYVLVGTLISFTATIVIGLVALFCINTKSSLKETLTENKKKSLDLILESQKEIAAPLIE